MLKYILKRLLYVVFVFFIVSILMFAIYKMVPGDPARMMIDSTKAGTDPVRYQQMYDAAREKLGLDKPIVVQYFSWIGNMITGDFGFSTQYRRPVSEVIGAPLWNTIKLNIVTFVLVFLICIPLGIKTAVKKYSAFDNTVQVGSVIGYSLPQFVVALVFIFLFAVKLPIFPISGSVTAGSQYTGIQYFFDMIYHMLLPALVMTFASIGSITRYVRASMIEALQMDYVRTARAKGLREKVVIYSHALRNALIPMVTIITGWLVGLFGGSVIIESIFSYNGIGNMLITSLKQQDFSVVLAIQMFYVILVLAGNLIMDLGYCLVDPRVKLD